MPLHPIKEQKKITFNSFILTSSINHPDKMSRCYSTSLVFFNPRHSLSYAGIASESNEMRPERKKIFSQEQMASDKQTPLDPVMGSGRRTKEKSFGNADGDGSTSTTSFVRNYESIDKSVAYESSDFTKLTSSCLISEKEDSRGEHPPLLKQEVVLKTDVANSAHTCTTQTVRFAEYPVTEIHYIPRCNDEIFHQGSSYKTNEKVQSKHYVIIAEEDDDDDVFFWY